ncbi:MAG TPA: metallophosphoesterase family protein [Terriglobales bacterium]|nr:metallophosphoesterase family protein [Terriglobales bacterium]
MRILVLSDIHGNLDALEACLGAAGPYDTVVNLGDIVGYGASPNEVIERSRSLGKCFVRGNHDRATCGLMDLKDFNPIAGLAALWTRDQLTPENLEWLRSLPQGPVQIPEVPEVQFVHGSPIDEDEYLVTLHDALEPLSALPLPVTFFGHTHLQGAFSFKTAAADAYRPPYKTIGQNESTKFALERDVRYLVNPGSVGQPRDGDWRAASAIFDTDTWIVTFQRAPYNLKSAQDRIFAANLPQRLATRLAAGR